MTDDTNALLRQLRALLEQREAQRLSASAIMRRALVELAHKEGLQAARAPIFECQL